MIITDGCKPVITIHNGRDKALYTATRGPESENSHAIFVRIVLWIFTSRPPGVSLGLDLQKVNLGDLQRSSPGPHVKVTTWRGVFVVVFRAIKDDEQNG